MIILSSLILLPHVKNILTEAGITGAFCVVTAIVPLSKTEEDGVQRFFSPLRPAQICWCCKSQFANATQH